MRRTAFLLPLALIAWAVGAPVLRAQCAGTLAETGMDPLPDLGPGYYRGEPGGLYPGGTNTRPPGHLARGLAIAEGAIVPRDAAGAPDPEGGWIGLVSIGMSNTSQEFSAFMTLAQADPARNPRLVIINGAQGGRAAEDWAAGEEPWSVLRARVEAAGLSPLQVQVAWMKHANRKPARLGTFDAHARSLASDLAAIVSRLRSEYPNVRILYLSSRTRAWTDDPNGLNPEPFAYESGFAVRWVIEEQLEGAPGSSEGEWPWLSWGPYLWADGERPRSDGLVWTAEDLRNDCTHPSPSGREKVARQLLAFLKCDPTAAPWFLRARDPAEAPELEIRAEALEGPAPLDPRFVVLARPSVPGRTIREIAWSFDDGTTYLGAEPPKTFPAPGEYQVRVTVADSEGAWTSAAVIARSLPAASVRFMRGDCNGDGAQDVSDAVYLLLVLFRGLGPPSCLDACDAAGDGALDVADAVRLLRALFSGGPPPAPPFPDCGVPAGGLPLLGCSGFPHCP